MMKSAALVIEAESYWITDPLGAWSSEVFAF